VCVRCVCMCVCARACVRVHARAPLHEPLDREGSVIDYIVEEVNRVPDHTLQCLEGVFVSLSVCM